MSKRSKAEPTAADTAATPAPVQVMRLCRLPAAQGGQAALAALVVFIALPTATVLRSSHDGSRPRGRRMAP